MGWRRLARPPFAVKLYQPAALVLRGERAALSRAHPSAPGPFRAGLAQSQNPLGPRGLRVCDRAERCFACTPVYIDRLGSLCVCIARKGRPPARGERLVTEP